MDEAEWLATIELGPSSIGLLPERPSDRKLRLFAVACCRRITRLFDDPRCIAGLDLAERLADDSGLIHERKMVRRAVHDASGKLEYTHAGWAIFRSLDNSAYLAAIYATSDVHRSVQRVAVWHSGSSDQDKTGSIAISVEMRAQLQLLRDILGNPFRPVTFAPEWRTSTVLGVADAIYADRTFGNLPILADALEDAGCDHADILSHCRGPGPHVRGCWVVDLVLGKS